MNEHNDSENGGRGGLRGTLARRLENRPGLNLVGLISEADKTMQLLQLLNGRRVWQERKTLIEWTNCLKIKVGR